jgi:hypothetical protein
LPVISKPVIKHGEVLGDFFEKMMKCHIMKIQNPDESSINFTLNMLIKNPKSILFSEYLKYLQNQQLFLRTITRQLLYKVLQANQDEQSKSYLKGFIEQLFSDETIKKIKNK